MNKIVAILITLVLISSCRENATEKTTEETPSKPQVSLYTFDGGSVSANDLSLFAQGDTYKGESKELVDAFYVIKHEKGILLWDTGLPEGLVGQDPYTPEGGAFTVSRKDSIVNQLASINVKPEDVNFIAFSHVHFDHTGAANHFGDATWLIQLPEYHFARGEAIKSNAFYDISSFDKLTKAYQLGGDHDVFGDGSVIIKSFPGHTLGISHYF